jgi:DNA replication and repair protein RecF
MAAAAAKLASAALAAGRPATRVAALEVESFRGYDRLEVEFPHGPQLVWGPNAAGKTSLLEAIVLLAWGHSHRTTVDAEMIRWGDDVARVEARLASSSRGDDRIEVALVRPGSTSSAAGARKRIRVNGVPRRTAALGAQLRVVLFAPEDMLLVVGSPSLRRATLDRLASQVSPAYADALARYARALQQRNGLLRLIREETAAREELRYWDEPLLAAGTEVVEGRLRLLTELAGPLGAAHAEIAPDEADRASLALQYLTNAPAAAGESVRDALARRLVEAAEKEVWNETTLIGPHRDDLSFVLSGRDLAGFASRGQQRTAILALKLAELDLLASRDGRPPVLLLDDVFSELDPDRAAALVEHLPDGQTLLTTAGVVPAGVRPQQWLRVVDGRLVDEDRSS